MARITAATPITIGLVRLGCWTCATAVPTRAGATPAAASIDGDSTVWPAADASYDPSVAVFDGVLLTLLSRSVSFFCRSRPPAASFFNASIWLLSSAEANGSHGV